MTHPNPQNPPTAAPEAVSATETPMTEPTITFAQLTSGGFYSDVAPGVRPRLEPFVITADMEPAAAVAGHTRGYLSEAGHHLGKALDLLPEDHPARDELRKARDAVEGASERLRWPHLVMTDWTMPYRSRDAR